MNTSRCGSANGATQKGHTSHTHPPLSPRTVFIGHEDPQSRQASRAHARTDSCKGEREEPGGEKREGTSEGKGGREEGREGGSEGGREGAAGRTLCHGQVDDLLLDGLELCLLFHDLLL